MDLSEKKSKVAICEKCKCYVKACHTDYLSKGSEKEFNQAVADGFTVKIETLIETRKRMLSSYNECKNGECRICVPEVF